MEKKQILEIRIDKENESGASIFEQVLIVLHNTTEEVSSRFGLKTHIRPSFSFEIAKIGNKIRFFIVCNTKYTGFLSNQIYAHFSSVEIYKIKDYISIIPNKNINIGKVGLKRPSLLSIKTFDGGEQVDPYSSITRALLKTGNNTLNAFIVNFSPIPGDIWKDKLISEYNFENSKTPVFIKMLIKFFKKFSLIFSPFIWIIRVVFFLFTSSKDDDASESNNTKKDSELSEDLKSKLSLLGYGVDISILTASEDETLNKINIKEIFSTLGVYENFLGNSLELKKISNTDSDIYDLKTRTSRDSFILSPRELSGLVHIPTTYVKTPNINWILSKNFEPPIDLPILNEINKDSLTALGETNFRGNNLIFGIMPEDRRRHMYIIGKTGMGKSTLLENMILDDIKKGRGVAVIDPHGDLAETIIGNIPKNRTNATIIFDPSDRDWPIAFNMFDGVSLEHRSFISSGLIGIFKRIFGDSWGPRLEHILRNTILALLEYPNSTMMSIPLMLTSESYRNKVVAKVSDPVVHNFWTDEFAKMQQRQQVEATGPILNKVGQFLSSPILRNILGQTKNTFDIRWAIDNKKIVIVNLSKGLIGEDRSALLGAMMVTKFQLDAMSRADIPESKREDFYLYVDEFQNFATDSFATILSEARKYKLNLVMANQYIDQMTETVRGAVFGNVGTTISFQVGYLDSIILKEVLGGDVSTEDLTNLRKYSIYLKQLIDGMPSKIFSADTLPPNPVNKEVFDSRYQKILQVSREKYSKPRDKVEKSINKAITQSRTQQEKLDQIKRDRKDKAKNKTS